MQKRQFIAKGRETYGEQLQASLNHHISLVKTVSVAKTQAARGRFYDIEDLTERYQNKPQQLANIIANARRMHCEIRGVDLYEDMDYTAVAEVYESSEQRQESTLSFREDLKKPKAKAKSCPKAKAQSSPSSSSTAKTLTANQAKLLGRWVDKTNVLQTKIQRVIEEARPRPSTV